MSYCIDYGCKPREHRMAGIIRRCIMTGCALASFLLLVNCFWPEGRLLLKNIFLTERTEETLQAIEAFAQEVDYGFSPGDALKNFIYAISKIER